MAGYYLQNEHIAIPEWFLAIPYNAAVIPPAGSLDLAQTGSNCQVFAYGLLRFNNLTVPDYRSSELWNDGDYSVKILADFRPLDILFFNATPDPYGAHLGVYIGEGKVIHNSKRVGCPAVWPLADFSTFNEYRVLLGGKRFRAAK